ncbi:hypothetical protein [Streptomyces poriticola]|uniref:hypothetical protein n=1 Tax=Streptomyces poriticola TaxID=3120506 RepID=UPI0038CD3E83
MSATTCRAVAAVSGWVSGDSRAYGARHTAAWAKWVRRSPYFRTGEGTGAEVPRPVPAAPSP